MENYYDLALLFLGFIAFVILWMSIENWIQRKEDKENSKKLQSNHQQIVRSKNSFLAIYGIKIKLDPNDKYKIESCANGSHKICKDAKKIALQTYCNRLTDGEDYFLYIGESLGELGIEYSDYISIEDSDIKKTMQSVKEKLTALQLNQSPALHLQSIYEY